MAPLNFSTGTLMPPGLSSSPLHGHLNLESFAPLKPLLLRYLDHHHAPLPTEDIAQCPWTTAMSDLSAYPEEMLSYCPSDVQDVSLQQCWPLYQLQLYLQYKPANVPA